MKKKKKKKSIWPDPLGITTSAGVQQTTGTSPHEWQDKPSGLRTGGQVTKKPALLDPGGGSPLFQERLQCELHGSEKYNEKGQGLGKRLGHHSVSRNHRRPDSEQATELASCLCPLAAVAPQKAPRRMGCAGQRQEEQGHLTGADQKGPAHPRV